MSVVMQETQRQTAQAKATLLALGMNIVNQVFDPNMN